MGMKNLSDVFCHRTDNIFAAVPDLLKIVDEELLQAATEEELLVKLRIALTACRAGNLTLSREKVCWGQEISCASYIIGDKGVFPDPKRTMAIANFPVPTNVTTLRGFLGLVNQLGHFLPDLAHLTVDLRQLFKKDVDFMWLQPHQEAFELILQILMSPLVVKPFDKELKTELLTDARRLKGLGYALIQRETDGTPHLIQCNSKSLTSAERGYAVIEIEGLAIQYAIEDCWFYLLGNKFTVFTDHRPLEGVFQKNLSEVMNPRLLSYRLKLVQYTDMEVIWTEGKSHLIADALSRNPIFDPPEDAGNHMALCYGAQPKYPLLHSIYDAGVADPIYQSIVTAIKRR
jgi:hypothetical protein